MLGENEVNKLTDLFSPVQINEMRVKNRIAMAPMGNHLQADDGSVTEELLAYYETRSRGGAGLIISPFSSVSDGFPTLGVYSDDLIPGLKKLRSGRAHV